jgi:DNA-binding transcriptional LysR family regulator
MSNKRFDLPPLDLVQSFEAAARTLSFTQAAEELHLTQSAISRQIRHLEDRLGVRLFERRHRALALTEDGLRFQAVATDVLERLQQSVDLIRAGQRQKQVSITTTSGFAAFWLIPRLKRFSAAHPDIDVRLSATNTNVNLERSLVDLAIRYCDPGAAPAGSQALFGEEIVPVCSPALTTNNSAPLRTPADLARHALLHLDNPGTEKTWFDWDTWLTSFGLEDLKPATAFYFEQYDQMIQAAISGQGIALGRMPVLDDLIASGALVVPFGRGRSGTRAYHLLRAEHTRRKPHVTAFCDWLFTEAARR